MKKWTIHIYIMALLASLLASCDSILGEEYIQEQDKVGISFTLSMNSAGVASRSLTSDVVTTYENTIDQDKFRVLAYTTDKAVHEVTIFSIVEKEDGIYQISGELKGKHSVEKVVILANCDKNFNLSTSDLSTLTYSFAGSDFNPETPKSYIPMWGAKKITTPLVPGTSTDIGTIHLLRAMAKIQVQLSEESIGCTLSSVKMTQYNTSGHCVPSLEETSSSTEVTTPTIPTGVELKADLTFHRMDDGSYMLYLPEYNNKDNQYLADIAVTVKDINGLEHNKSLKFGEYFNGAFTNYLDILRNYYYQFSLSLKVAANGQLNLYVEVEKYAEFELKPVYGDDEQEVE